MRWRHHVDSRRLHIRTLLLALLMIASPAFTSTPVAATPCPYGGCPMTRTFIDAPKAVERGDPARIRVRVTYDGNMTVEGRVTLVVVRDKGGFRWEDSKRYRDKRVSFRTPRLDKRGQYVIKVRFKAAPGSHSKDSDNRDSFHVKRRD